VRSAVKPVFEAVAHRSPYPSEFLDEPAWNQMVLKALFIGSELAPLQGLDERANPELAEVLLDYAHERWAAGRPVSPELWRCVGPFAQERALEDLERVVAGWHAAGARRSFAGASGEPRGACRCEAHPVSQRLKSPFVAGSSQVCISTIQRMYSTMKDEPLDESAEEAIRLKAWCDPKSRCPQRRSGIMIIGPTSITP
jgi:hypothetical protein